MKKKILIIEANTLEQQIISRFFSEEYEISFTRTVKDATKKVPLSRPQAIVLNLHGIGLKDIWDFANLKAVMGPEIPVIVIASDNSLQVERAFRQIGTYYYLTKPYEFRELAEAVQSIFTKPAVQAAAMGA
jgi:DNA-binding response OmpR family regulator